MVLIWGPEDFSPLGQENTSGRRKREGCGH